MYKILYLPVETVVRDLDANLFLAYKALKRNYYVVVGSKPQVKKFAKFVGSGIYLFKHWESVFPYSFDDPNRDNYIFIGFHPEGLVFNEKTFGEKMNVPGKSEKLDINFVYGKHQKKLLNSANPKLKNILSEVGHPRFDLLRTDFHYLYEKIANKYKKKHGPYILINTNFTCGNPAKFYKKGYLERKNDEKIKKWGIPLDQDEIKFIKGRIRYYENLTQSYIEMIKVLSSRVPGLKIILRPHPGENHDTYRKSLSDTKNVEVIHIGNVINWIIGADVVVQTGCTTAIESWASRKPVIRYNPLDNADIYESILPNLFGQFAKDVNELVHLINDIKSIKFSNLFDEQIHLAKPYIESIDGPYSTDLILDKIDQTFSLKTDQPLPFKINLDDYYSRRKKISAIKYEAIRYLEKREKILKHFIGQDKAKKFKSNHQKFPGLKKKYISSYISKLMKNDNEINHDDIEIEKVDYDTFLLLKN